MSRRRAVELDDDDYDDGFDDYEEESDDCCDAGASQYLWQSRDERRAGVPGESSAHAPLLDSLVEEFRACLGDARVPKEQVDSVLVAADYDPEVALAMLREQLSNADLARTQAASRLVASEPSAVAKMLEDDGTCDTQSELPLPPLPRNEDTCVENGAVPVVFGFDQPSPDDRVRQKQQAGRARVVAASGVPWKPNSRTRVVGTDMPPEGSNSARSSSNTGSASSTPLRSTSVAREPQILEKRSLEPLEVPAPKQRSRKLSIPSCARLSKLRPSISVVVAGHVDAGKSTLLGHLLRLLESDEVASNNKASGSSTASRRGRRKGDGGRRQTADPHPLAWGTDEDTVERTRGVTIDIATRTFRGRGQDTVFAVIDAPGHRDYVPAMILGSSQASAALLVVDTSVGEFEAGFSDEGQTREHAVLLRALGVGKLIVVANKMDMVDYSEARYQEVKETLCRFLKTLGWRPNKDIDFVPASGLAGVNLVNKAGPDASSLASWYEGNSLLDSLESLSDKKPETSKAASDGPTRLVVSDSYRSASLGGTIAISGRLVSGTVAVRDCLRLCPSTQMICVKSIEVGDESREGVNGFAVAGVDNLPVSLGLEGVPDTLLVSPGDVLCDPQNPVPVVRRFRGQVVVICTPVPIVQGVQVELHVGGMCEAATVSRLVEVKRGPDGSALKRPRQFLKGASGILEVRTSRPICIDVAKNAKSLSRFALRCEGRTMAAGVVTALLKEKADRNAGFMSKAGGADAGEER